MLLELRDDGLTLNITAFFVSDPSTTLQIKSVFEAKPSNYPQCLLNTTIRLQERKIASQWFSSLLSLRAGWSLDGQSAAVCGRVAVSQ